MPCTGEGMKGRIIYLVAGTPDQGRKDALSRGGRALANFRYALPDNTDLRVVCRFNDMVPYPGGKTPLVRGSDYDSPPEGMSETGERAWFDNHERFERFVADGHGEWIES